MKYAFKLPMTAVMLVLALATGLAGLDKSKIRAEIQKAAGHFLDPKAGASDCRTAFMLLIGAIEQAAPESGFPAAFGAQISEARRIFESTSILNPNGIKLLNEAYTAINDGQPFLFPKELAGPDLILARFEKMSAGVQTSLEAGQTGAAVKSLLEILIMIVTPIEAQA